MSLSNVMNNNSNTDLTPNEYGELMEVPVMEALQPYFGDSLIHLPVKTKLVKNASGKEEAKPVKDANYKLNSQWDCDLIDKDIHTSKRMYRESISVKTVPKKMISNSIFIEDDKGCSYDPYVGEDGYALKEDKSIKLYMAKNPCNGKDIELSYCLKHMKLLRSMREGVSKDIRLGSKVYKMEQYLPRYTAIVVGLDVFLLDMDSFSEHVEELWDTGKGKEWKKNETGKGYNEFANLGYQELNIEEDLMPFCVFTSRIESKEGIGITHKFYNKREIPNPWIPETMALSHKINFIDPNKSPLIKEDALLSKDFNNSRIINKSFDLMIARSEHYAAMEEKARLEWIKHMETDHREEFHKMNNTLEDYKEGLLWNNKKFYECDYEAHKRLEEGKRGYIPFNTSNTPYRIPHTPR